MIPNHRALPALNCRRAVGLPGLLVVTTLLAGTILAQANDPNGCIQLLCPEPILVECQSTNGTYVQYGLQAESLCQSQLTIDCSPASGTLFPPGETVVTCHVKDELGNAATCTFSVFVLDSQAPDIAAPKDFEVPCQSWMGAVVTWSATAEDACDGPVTVTCDPPSGSLLPNGRTRVTCTAEDASGNRATQFFTVMVTGDCGSNCVSIACPQDFFVDATNGADAVVDYLVTSSHACGGTATVTCDPPSGTAFPIGTSLVTCHADDGHGNGDTCTFRVVVRDATPPQLILPGTVVANCDKEDGSARVWFDVRARDNADHFPEVVCSPPSGSTFPGGTNLVTCTATDLEGNVASGSFMVVVVPGSACGAPPPLPDELAGDNWDFELGLVGWAAEGVAFGALPITGDAVPLERIPEVATDIAATIGGDYWKQVTFPVGHHGSNWVGTADMRTGVRSRVGPGLETLTGRLVSKPFVVQRNFVTFLIGGDDEAGLLSVQLVREEPDPNGLPPALVTVAEATAHGSEIMRREWWNVTALKGERLRVLIEDRSFKGHLNVDDFRFQDIEPSQEAVMVAGRLRPAAVFMEGYWYDWDAPIWGVVDMHTHPMTHLGFGQIVFHGEPDGPIEHALRDCNCSHGGFGFDNPCGNYFREAVIKAMDSEGPDPHRQGWDDNPWLRFKKWPVFNSISHQQMWHEWIRRAHNGGLRVMVVLCVNNKLLGGGALGPGPLDDKTVGDLQIQGLTNFVARHSDFMEIAHDPWELRDIVRRNKLAIIIGVELDDPGNFNTMAEVTPDMVRDEIRRLHGMGVRYFFPIHLTDNKFGGMAVYGDLFNISNKHANGVPLSVMAAPEEEHINFTLEHMDLLSVVDDIDGGAALGFALAGPLVLPALATPFADVVANSVFPGLPPGTASGAGGALGMSLPAILGTIVPLGFGAALIYLDDAGISLDTIPIGGNYPAYPAAEHGHMNTLGLTPLGEEAVYELMRLGMMIDIDHMSHLAVSRVLDKAEESACYYPLNSGHNSFRDMRWVSSENQRSTNQLARILQFGGMMGIGYGNEDMRAVDSVLTNREFSSSMVRNTCGGTSRSFAQSYLYALEKMQGGQVALGTDINGFVMGPGPRFGPQSAFGIHHERLDSNPRMRPDQVRDQFNGVAYTPAEGRPILGAAFDGRSVDPDRETEPARYSEGYQFNKEQRDFFAALRAFKWNPSMSQSDAGALEGLFSDNYNKRRVKELLVGLLIGVTDEAPGHDILDGDVGTKQQIAKAVYRYEVLGEPPPSDVVNDDNKNRRYGQLRSVWHFYHRIYGDNEPLTRATTDFKQWDINFEGVAHYGLLPDFFQDLKNVGVNSDDLSPIFTGAEYFADMWEHTLKASADFRPRFIEDSALRLLGPVLELRFVDTADEYLLEATSSITSPSWKEATITEKLREGAITVAHVPYESGPRFFRLRRR